MTEPADRKAGSSAKNHSLYNYGKGLKEGVGKRFGTDTEFIAIHDASWYKTDGRNVRKRPHIWWETRDNATKTGTSIDAPSKRERHTAGGVRLGTAALK